MKSSLLAAACVGMGIAMSLWADVAQSQTAPPPAVATEQPALVVASSGGRFTRIQAAVDAANAGQTIEIHSGTYYENVIVNKTITLRGVDSGAGLPVVDARKQGSAVTLTADGVTLHGLVAVNSGTKWGDAGIVVLSKANTLSGNVARKNKTGIIVRRCDNNTLENNEAIENENGISLEGASDSLVRKNTARQNRATGIIVAHFHRDKQSQFALRNTIDDNVVEANRDGIIVGHMAHENIIRQNQVVGNRDNGVVVNCGPSKNVILLNHIQDNKKFGVLFTCAGFGNMVVANQVTGNESGMGILSSSWNGFTRNRVANNRSYGILMTDMGVLLPAAARNMPGQSELAEMHPVSSNNVIWENDLADNKTNAYDAGGKPWRLPAMIPNANRQELEQKMNEAMTLNRWDKDDRGNHYSTFDEPSEGCMDADHNGVGDRAYPIPGGKCVDHFPLVTPPNTTTAPDPLPSVLPPGAEIPGLMQGTLPGMMPGMMPGTGAGPMPHVPQPGTRTPRK